MRRLSLLGTMLLALSAGCPATSKSGDAGTDAGAVDSGNADSGPFSICGHPNDKGNSKDIGQYCDSNTPCTNQALLCSTIEAQFAPDAGPTYFCTLPGCDPCASAATTLAVCGENAFCGCLGTLGCGCTPSSCSALATDAGSMCTADGGAADAGATDAG